MSHSTSVLPLLLLLSDLHRQCNRLRERWVCCPSVTCSTAPRRVTKIRSAACVSLLCFLLALHFCKKQSATSAFSACLWTLVLISPLGERADEGLTWSLLAETVRNKRFCVSLVSGFLSEKQPRSPGFLLLGLYSGWGRQTICFHTEHSTYALLYLVTYCKAIFFTSSSTVPI